MSIAITGIIGGILYAKLYGDGLESVRANLSRQLRDIGFSLKFFLDEVGNDVDALTADESVRTRDDRGFTSFLEADERTFQYHYGAMEERIIGIFNTYRTTHRYVSSVYMGRENGSFVRSHKRERPTQYDPRDRPWYILGKNNPHRVMTTDAYPSVTTDDINIGVVKALVDDRGFCYGVLGVDVTLVDLAEYIRDYETGSSGEILVMDRKGFVLASRDKEIRSMDIAKYSPDLKEKLSPTGEGTATVTFKGRNHYLFYGSPTGQGWRIAALIPSVQIGRLIGVPVLWTVVGLAVSLLLSSSLILVGLHRLVIGPWKRLAEETKDQLAETKRKLKKEIGERILMGQMLFEREARYSDLVESANNIILRWQPDGRVVFFNRFAQDFFGFDEKEIIGRNIVGTILAAKDSAGHELAPLASDIVAHPEAYVRNVNQNIRKNGEHVWIAWANKPIRDQGGQIAEILSIGVDITRLVQKESELRQALEELARAKERADAADRVKSVFLATMSHELRTPLNAIIGFTGSLLQGIAGPLNEEQAKHLHIVRESARHLLSLISDVLDIAKLEAGQLKVGHDAVDLRASIQKVAQAMKPLAEKKGLSFEVEIAPETGPLHSDERRLEQILSNLVGNAIKFTDKGRVSIHCGTVPGFIVFSVTDTGIGIKEEEFGKIFMPFYQVDFGLARIYEGSGLGLPISRKLVELLGGTIRVESAAGKGSTFSFRLPSGGRMP